MTDISFSCPHCQQHLSAPPEMAGNQLACPTCQNQIQVPTPTFVRLTPQQGPLTGRLIAGIIGGLIFAVFAANVFAMIVVDPTAKDPDNIATAITGLVFIGLWVASIVIALKVQRAAKVWRYLLISSACLSFALPLAGCIFSAKAIDQYSTQGAPLEAVASAGAGGVIAIALSIIGFFLGAIFLTVGLLIGRDRKDAK